MAYPFGMLVPNRHGSSNSYRYGFQGQEKDDELKGEGNSLNYTFRMHDPRVGRFFAVDPLFKEFAWSSPYSFSENMPIHLIEIDGLKPGPPRYMRRGSKAAIRDRANRNKNRYGVVNSGNGRPSVTRVSTIDFAPKGGPRPSRPDARTALQKYSEKNIKEFISTFNLTPSEPQNPIGISNNAVNAYRLAAEMIDLVSDMETVFKTQGMIMTSYNNDGGGNVFVKSKNFNYMPKDGRKQLILISLESEYQKEFSKTLNEKVESMNGDKNNNMPDNLKYSSAYFATLAQLGDSPQTMFNKIVEKSLKDGDSKTTKVQDIVQPQLIQGN